MKKNIFLFIFLFVISSLSAQRLDHNFKEKRYDDKEIIQKVDEIISGSEITHLKQKELQWKKVYDFFYDQKHVISRQDSDGSKKGESSFDPCTNGGFELGDFTGFTGSTSLYSMSSDGCNLPVSYSDVELPLPLQIELVKPGIDPYTGIDMVHSGDKAARLNSDAGDWNGKGCTNAWPGYGIDKLSMEIEVTAENSFFSFWYAVVLQNPDGHTNLQPFFHVQANTNSDMDLVDEFCIVSSPDDQFFQSTTSICKFSNEPIRYRDWDCYTLDLQSAIGQTVTIDFIAADCGAGAHWGYVYLDDLCTDCNGSSSGNIELNPTDSCASLPVEICGSYTLPNLNGAIGSLESLMLQIRENGEIVHEIPLPDVEIDESDFTFCFDFLSEFYSGDGPIDISIEGSFLLNGQSIIITSSDAIPGVDNDLLTICCDDLSLTAYCTVCGCGGPAYVIHIMGAGTTAEALEKYTFLWTIDGETYEGGNQSASHYEDGFAYQIDVNGIEGTPYEGCTYTFIGVMYCDGDCPEVTVETCTTVQNPLLIEMCEDSEYLKFLVDNNGNLLDPEQYSILWTESWESENPIEYWPGSCGPHEVQIIDSECNLNLEYTIDECGYYPPQTECNNEHNQYGDFIPDIIWPEVCGTDYYEVKVIELGCNNQEYTFIVDEPLSEEIYGQTYYGFSFSECEGYSFQVKSICLDGTESEFSDLAYIKGGWYCFHPNDANDSNNENSMSRISKNQEPSNFEIFPSLVIENEFTIRTNSISEHHTIQIYNTNGKKVFEEIISGARKEFVIQHDLSTSGLYFIVISNDEKDVYTQKIEYINK